MDIISIIERKKNGKMLTKSDIQFFIDGLLDGSVKDYQASALLMAVCINGMTDEETINLTQSMVGKRLDLSGIGGVLADKHSSGGVGDKVTIAIAPIVAVCGVKMPKMSGKGLGHTGGTIDKLSAIPNFKTDLTYEEIINITNEVGCCISAQTDNIAPADKILYSLRSVTGTVDSLPLVASSIMSKKIASGCDVVSLDIKCGNGAFMKNIKDAEKLSELMKTVGEKSGMKVSTHINDMNEPLGYCIGNALEVIEVIEFLKNNPTEPKMKQLFIDTAVDILKLADAEDADKKVAFAIESGKALEKFKRWVSAQGGNPNVCDDYSLFGKADIIVDIVSTAEGTVDFIDCKQLGHTSALLGAGRIYKDDKIDYTAGIRIYKKLGDKVSVGERIATIYTSKKDIYHEASKAILDAFHLID